ncbi:type II toxin-antitoxin system MqsA family antitoxin [Pseudomonas siliginis]|uniref:type II toxin-antitoxin system MqsA family antitoxin n=1 Tax=Pseudomonas siliginis TaxID=2842346 RepID=UPI002092D1C6|nr:type II toxin-antitoxin system MqsA family antitoxin [Pseudomonas siliginis]UST72309.1 type II toxin-antitoxin system MqsA family antitoxin [Pseudomonas siliginis]
MNLDKHSRTISLQCPTCGGASFESEIGEDTEVKCVQCGRVIERDELLRENSENIQENLEEMNSDVGKDIARQMRKALQDAFKGNKNIKIK